MRKKRTLAVRFSEPSGLLAYSAAPARNAAMSMMKPVDNHTTSMGRIVIIGSRTVTRNDSSQLISVASVRYGSFLFASREQNVAAGRPGRRPAGWKPIRTIEKSRASPRKIPIRPRLSVEICRFDVKRRRRWRPSLIRPTPSAVVAVSALR